MYIYIFIYLFIYLIYVNFISIFKIMYLNACIAETCSVYWKEE